jgi:hypothetical protein
LGASGTHRTDGADVSGGEAAVMTTTTLPRTDFDSTTAETFSGELLNGD